MPTWVAPITAVASLAFAIWSWWSANKSKAAKAKAESAQASAEKQAEAVNSQALAVTDIAETLGRQQLLSQGPPWEVRHQDGARYVLVNRTGSAAREVRFTALANDVQVGEVPFPGEQIVKIIKASGFQGAIDIMWMSPGGEPQSYQAPVPAQRR